MASSNITWHPGRLSRSERWKLLGQHGMTLWLTGLPASGKSTLAASLQERLTTTGRFAYVLDGDNLRHGLCSDLGFEQADREENIRRTGELACLFADAGAVAIAALVSPYAESRRRVRALHEANGIEFREVFVSTSIAECMQRDPKGLWARARAGEISHFTGITDTYEAPTDADLVLSGTLPIQNAVSALVALVERTTGRENTELNDSCPSQLRPAGS